NGATVMILLRNQLFHRVQIFWLRLYLVNFHVLGIMRLKFDKSRKRLRLTPHSVGVSRMIGLLLGFCQCQVMTSEYSHDLDILPLGFIIFLLIQPRSVFVKRIKLVNKFLKQFEHPYRPPNPEISLSAPFSWGFKFLVLVLTYIEGNADFDLFFSPPKWVFCWIMYMSTDLLNIGISMLSQFFNVLSGEMSDIAEELTKAIRRADQRKVKKLQHRFIQLQDQHQACSKIVDAAFDCLGPQLLFMTYSNISFLWSLSFRNRISSLSSTFLGINLRSFILSLDQVFVLSSVWNTIPWKYMAHTDQWEENILNGSYAERKEWTRYQHQCLIAHLLQPKHKIFGLFTPNKRYLFQIGFVLCSLTYFRIMWK
ncbi:hypothetical protein KR018_007505, partial [Drosophila ironensis]